MGTNRTASVEDGLPLGLRFYDTLGKQKRFTFDCARGVSHNEYQYTDGCVLPPFQVVRATIPSEDIDITLVCVDSGDEYDINTLCPDVISALAIVQVEDYDTIVYKADNDCCSLNLGTYGKILAYLVVEDGTNTWYSELFRMDSGLEDAETYYRDWTPSQHRSYSPTELRIWNT